MNFAATALMPVIEGNLEVIRMPQRAGVNYSKKLRYQGATASDFAE